MMIFKVTKQYADGKEQLCKQFKTMKEAKAHAYESASENALMKIKIVYRIYEFDDLLETVDSNNLQPSQTVSAPAEDGAPSGGMQSGATFKPTPFEMAPRPGGTPPKWIIDPEDDKNKDKDKDK